MDALPSQEVLELVGRKVKAVGLSLRDEGELLAAARTPEDVRKLLVEIEKSGTWLLSVRDALKQRFVFPDASPN